MYFLYTSAAGADSQGRPSTYERNTQHAQALIREKYSVTTAGIDTTLVLFFFVPGANL